jgi:hypothetical protein
LPKNLCDGIQWIAEVEYVTKKNAAEQLMTLGFSSYMGGKVKEQIELDKQAK